MYKARAAWLQRCWSGVVFIAQLWSDWCFWCFTSNRHYSIHVRSSNLLSLSYWDLFKLALRPPSLIMVEILPIRRKTPYNESINQSIKQVAWLGFYSFALLAQHNITYLSKKSKSLHVSLFNTSFKMHFW